MRLKNDSLKFFMAFLKLSSERSFDLHFGFDQIFVRARSYARAKLRARKVGRLERDLSTPDLYFRQLSFLTLLLKNLL